MNKKNNILVLPGDGIGPEVCDEAIKVLKHLNDIYKLDIVIEESAVGEVHTKNLEILFQKIL